MHTWRWVLGSMGGTQALHTWCWGLGSMGRQQALHTWSRVHAPPPAGGWDSMPDTHTASSRCSSPHNSAPWCMASSQLMPAGDAPFPNVRRSLRSPSTAHGRHTRTSSHACIPHTHAPPAPPTQPAHLQRLDRGRGAAGRLDPLPYRRVHIPGADVAEGGGVLVAGRPQAASQGRHQGLKLVVGGGGQQGGQRLLPGRGVSGLDEAWGVGREGGERGGGGAGER